ncbi:hypothetical protein ACEQPO_07720 [Bacillus sp. SL00103]
MIQIKNLVIFGRDSAILKKDSLKVLYRKTISDVLEDMDMRHYFGNVSKEDFL